MQLYAGIVSRARCKKGDRRLAPLSPYETAGQSTEKIIRSFLVCVTGMTPVNLRYRGLARTPGLRAAFAAPRLRRRSHGNTQPVTAAVATRRLWIGWCRRIRCRCCSRSHYRTGYRRKGSRTRSRSRHHRSRSCRRHHSHKDNSRSMGSRSPSPTKGPSPTNRESRSRR